GGRLRRRGRRRRGSQRGRYGRRYWRFGGGPACGSARRGGAASRDRRRRAGRGWRHCRRSGRRGGGRALHARDGAVWRGALLRQNLGLGGRRVVQKRVGLRYEVGLGRAVWLVGRGVLAARGGIGLRARRFLLLDLGLVVPSEKFADAEHAAYRSLERLTILSQPPR